MRPECAESLGKMCATIVSCWLPKGRSGFDERFPGLSVTCILFKGIKHSRKVPYKTLFSRNSQWLPLKLDIVLTPHQGSTPRSKRETSKRSTTNIFIVRPKYCWRQKATKCDTSGDWWETTNVNIESAWKAVRRSSQMTCVPPLSLVRIGMLLKEIVQRRKARRKVLRVET